MKAPDKQKRHYVTRASFAYRRDVVQYVVFVSCLYGHESRIEDAVSRDLVVRTLDASFGQGKALAMVKSINEACAEIKENERRLATLAELFGVGDESKVVVVGEGELECVS